MNAMKENLTSLAQAVQVLGVIAGLVGVFSVAKYRIEEHEKRIIELEADARQARLAILGEMSLIRSDVSGMRGEMTALKSIIQRRQAAVADFNRGPFSMNEDGK